MGEEREVADQRDLTKRMVGAAMVSGFIAGLDATSQFFIYPAIREQLANNDSANASWILTVTGIVGAAVLLQIGRVADRFGSYRVLLGGAVLYAVATFGATFAPTLQALVVARGFQAGGLAAVGVTSIAVIVRSTPPERLAGALGLWGFFTAISGVLGPPLASGLIEIASWRLAFAIQIPFALVIVVLALPGWTNDRGQLRTASVDYLGGALAMIGLGLVVLAVLEGRDWGWGSAQTLLVLLFGLASIGLVVLRSRTHEDPVIPLELFNRLSYVISLFIGFLSNMGFFGMWLALLAWMTDVWDYSVLSAGLLLTIMPGTMMLLSTRAGRLVDRVGFRSVMAGGATVFALGFFLGAFMLGSEPSTWRILPVIIAGGLGMATVFPSTTAAATRTLEAHRVATGTGLLQTVQKVGGGLGPAIVVALLATGEQGDVGAHRSTLLFIGITGVVVALLSSLLTQQRMALRTDS